MPPIEDQRRASVTYARTSAFSELDHQLIGHPSPNVGPLPGSGPLTVHHQLGLRTVRCRAYGSFRRSLRFCAALRSTRQHAVAAFTVLTDGMLHANASPIVRQRDMLQRAMDAVEEARGQHA